MRAVAIAALLLLACSPAGSSSTPADMTPTCDPVPPECEAATQQLSNCCGIGTIFAAEVCAQAAQSDAGIHDTCLVISQLSCSDLHARYASQSPPVCCCPSGKSCAPGSLACQ